jgi:hypothetical protein
MPVGLAMAQEQEFDACGSHPGAAAPPRRPRETPAATKLRASCPERRGVLLSFVFGFP